MKVASRFDYLQEPETELNPIEIQCHPYSVQYASHLNQRDGFLVKVKFEDGIVGFADLMAWPELGDQTLEKERLALADLTRTDFSDGSHAQKNKRTQKARELSKLSSQVLRNSWIDGRARAEHRSLWTANLKIPASHYLVGTSDDLERVIHSGLPNHPHFPKSIILKVKWTRTLSASLIQACENKIRIDFNERAEPDDLKRLFSDLNTLDKIDFIEDPFDAAQPEHWAWAEAQFPNLRIFGDFALDKNPQLEKFCRGVVLKPASRDVRPWVETKKSICITHSLGHPLGQMTSAHYACHFAADHFSQNEITTGLLPGTLVLNSELPIWNMDSIPPGEGFGYVTEQLLALPWEDA